MCFRPTKAKKDGNKCPQCQTVNADGDDVCVSCGAALPSSAASAPGVPAPGVGPSQGAPKAPISAPKAPPAPPKS